MQQPPTTEGDKAGVPVEGNSPVQVVGDPSGSVKVESNVNIPPPVATGPPPFAAYVPARPVRKAGFRTGCRNVGLLLHKNFLLRRRHWCLCCCEFALPLAPILIFTGGLLIMNLMIKSSGAGDVLDKAGSEGGGVGGNMPDYDDSRLISKEDEKEIRKCRGRGFYGMGGGTSRKGGKGGGTARDSLPTTGSVREGSRKSYKDFTLYCERSGNLKTSDGGGGDPDRYRDTHCENEVVGPEANSCVVAFAPENEFTKGVVDAIIRMQGSSGHEIEWRGYKSEGAIEAAWKKHSLKKMKKKAMDSDFQLRAAIVFEGTGGSYKLRMVDRANLFTSKVLEGTISQGQEEQTEKNVLVDDGGRFQDSIRYERSGFTSFQIFVDRALIYSFTGRDPVDDIEFGRLVVPSHEQDKRSISKEMRSLLFDYLLPPFFAMSFVMTVPPLMKGVISERETGMKELLKIYGMSNWMHWVSWIITCSSTTCLSLTIIGVALYAASIIQNTNFLLTWAMLLLYGLSSTTFLLFLSSLFEKPSVAIACGCVVWIVSFFALWAPTVDYQTYRMFSLGEKYAMGLIPNIALAWGIRTIGEHEKRAVGLGFGKFFQPLSNVDDLSFLHVLLMFILDIALYLFLALYLEAVLPSTHGTRKPFYFIFRPLTPQFWRKSKPRVSPSGPEQTLNRNPETGFEDYPEGFHVGLDIRNLVKTFGKKSPSVAGLSVKMLDGEIFALLGHNGAGKTTTISCCIGMMSPTSGTVIVNGYDIHSDLDAVRSQIGICLQHNLLFDEMNVMEHLTFFAKVRGMKSAQARRSAEQLAKSIQLGEKLKTRSTALSGGQKRKLCLGIALVGDAKVVFLDEPTSGMDVEARRAIWDVLLNERDGRTIILTTHFMEEADVLGDRIGIMTEGVLQCLGTPPFLKKFYGTGYTLTIMSEDDSRCAATLELVQRTVQTAKLKDAPAVATSPYEWSILLPTVSVSSAIFPAMFKDLESNKLSLGIRTMALSQTTLDEVFVRAGDTRRDIPQQPNADAARNKILLTPQVPLRGFRLLLKQLGGLLLKRASYTLRKLSLLWILLALPILMMVAVLAVSYKATHPPIGLFSLEISFKNYRNIHTYYRSQSEIRTLESHFKKLMEPYSKLEELSMGENKMDDALEKVGSGENFHSFKEKNLVAVEFGNSDNKDHIAISFSIFPYHTSPLAINLASNTMLRHFGDGQNKASGKDIHVKNHPLQYSRSAIDVTYSPQLHSYPTVSVMFLVMISLALILVAATFVVAPVEERICSGKQLQLMTGTSAVSYWFAYFLWDSFMVILALGLMVVWFPILQTSFFATKGALGGLLVIFVVYAFCAIPFSYLWSLNAKSVAGGFSFLTTLHIVTGLLFPLLVFTLDFINYNVCVNAMYVQESAKNRFDSFDSREVIDFEKHARNMFNAVEVLTRIFRVFPVFGVSMCFLKYTGIALDNAQCDLLPDDFQQIRCSVVDQEMPQGDWEWNFRKCCKDWCHKTAGGCHVPKSHFSWNYVSVVPGGVIHPYFLHSAPGPGQELAYMFLMGIFYNFLLLLVEFGVISKIKAVLHRSSGNAFNSFAADEDVQEEAQRVQNLVWTGRVNEEALIVDDFCKSYGSFSAVSHLSFGVHNGECFGLLGVNGAGKTTTFRMLTGDEQRSCGNAYAKNCNLDESRTQFLKGIGYCPQFDGLTGVLTGREMILLFGRLRGVPSVQKECNNWLSHVGLSESGNVQCRKYSGGMKRRLCAAMAMIGNPNLVLLDEPVRFLVDATTVFRLSEEYGRRIYNKIPIMLMYCNLRGPIMMMAVTVGTDTSGVDPVARREFWKIIFAIKESGRSIILTSHSMDEIEACCPRLGIMVNGEMQCLGSVQHLKYKYAQGFTLIVKLKPPPQPVPSNVYQAPPYAQPQYNPPQPPLAQPQRGPPQPPLAQPPRGPPQPPLAQPQRGPPQPPFAQPQYGPPQQGFKPQSSAVAYGIQPSGNQPPQYGPPVFQNAPVVVEEDPAVEFAIKLHDEIMSRFSPCELKDEHKTTLQYQIYNTELPWNVLFSTMEELKATYSEILEEYTIADTSLEEVFLAFARSQWPVREAEVGCCKKCITCECMG